MLTLWIVPLMFLPVTTPTHMSDLMDYLIGEAWMYIEELPPDVPLNLDVSVRLEEIKEVDDVHETLSTKVRVKVNWSDSDFGWNSTDFSDLKSIILQQRYMWKPDIVILNEVSAIKALGSNDFPITVNGDDEIVYWAPVTIAVTKCEFDLEYYPFDVQKCDIKVGTAASSMNHIILEKTKCHVANDVVGTGSWTFKSIEHDVQIEVFDEDSHLEHQIIRCTVYIKRKPSFIVLNVIFPLIFLSILNSLSFLIPDDSGEKVSYSITLFLTFAVFITIMMDRMPENSDKVTKIQLYLMYQLGISVLIIIVCVVKLRIKADLQQFNSDKNNSHDQSEPERMPKCNSKGRSRSALLRRRPSSLFGRKKPSLGRRSHSVVGIYGSSVSCNNEENEMQSKRKALEKLGSLDKDKESIPSIKTLDNKKPNTISRDNHYKTDFNENKVQRWATIEDFPVFMNKDNNKHSGCIRHISKFDLICFCVVILLQIICNTWFFA